MSTIIRRPEELEARIAEKAAQEKQRNDFHDLAERRYAEIATTGKTIPWIEMRNYLEARIKNKAARLPEPACRKS